MINLYTSSQYLDLGIRDYEEIWKFQKKLHFLRYNDFIEDTFIFVEHSPGVYTIGRGANPDNYRGLNPILIERGGDVTYHGPGQLLIYPIVRVFRENERKDVRLFVQTLENIVMDTFRKLGFEPHLGEEPGIWVTNSPLGDRKVCSLGMKIDRGVSYHGLAINYGETALDGFMRIKPCGLDSSVMGYLGIEKEKLVLSILDTLRSSYRVLDRKNEEYFADNVKNNL